MDGFFIILVEFENKIQKRTLATAFSSGKYHGHGQNEYTMELASNLTASKMRVDLPDLVLAIGTFMYLPYIMHNCHKRAVLGCSNLSLI